MPGRLPTATDTDSAATAQAHAAIASPSSLDDPGFQNRVARREVGNFDPEQGLRFNLAIDLIGNTSVADVTRGIQAPTETPEEILHHPLLKNHDVTTSNQVEMGYQSFHLDGHFDNYRFDLQTRVEMSLNDPGKLRSGAILTQGIEDLEVLTGISNSDVFGDHRPVQYQLGLSYADIGNVQVETDGFMQPDVLKASLGFQVQDQLQIQGSFVMSTTNVNGSTHADYAGVVSLGTPLFTGED